jgi:hypothetical protein
MVQSGSRVTIDRKENLKDDGCHSEPFGKLRAGSAKNLLFIRIERSTTTWEMVEQAPFGVGAEWIARQGAFFRPSAPSEQGYTIPQTGFV